MNKWLMSLLVLSSPVLADDVVSHNNRPIAFTIEKMTAANSFTFESSSASSDVDDDSSGMALRIAYYVEKNRAFFLEYQREEFELGIYDASHKQLSSLNIGYLGEFPVGYGLAPYFFAALGIGSIDLDTSIYSQDSADVSNYKLGAGVAYYLSPAWRLHGAIAGQYATWTPVKISGVNLDISEYSLILAAGISYRF